MHEFSVINHKYVHALKLVHFVTWIFELECLCEFVVSTAQKLLDESHPKTHEWGDVSLQVYIDQQLKLVLVIL